jgi:hypothetical protein
VPVWLIVRSKRDRGAVAGTWAGALLFAPGLLWLNSESNGGSDSEAWFAGAVFAGLLLGTIVGVVRRRAYATLALIGALGGAGLAAAGLALLFGLLAVTGTCFD